MNSEKSEALNVNLHKRFSQISWVSLHGSCFLGVNIFAIKCILIQCTQFLEIFLIIQRLLTFSKVLLIYDMFASLNNIEKSCL